MKTYKLFIRKYNIMVNDYIVEERIVKTNDIYHEIGYIYCTTIEDIKRIGYVETKDIQFEYVKTLKMDELQELYKLIKELLVKFNIFK